MSARTQVKIENLIEDVDFLVQCKETPSRIAHRVDYRYVESLARRLRRHGRNDLATYLERMEEI